MKDYQTGLLITGVMQMPCGRRFMWWEPCVFVSQTLSRSEGWTFILSAGCWGGLLKNSGSGRDRILIWNLLETEMKRCTVVGALVFAPLCEDTSKCCCRWVFFFGSRRWCSMEAFVNLKLLPLIFTKAGDSAQNVVTAIVRLGLSGL